MREHDQSTPFYMMNLNKYYPQAQYASGEVLSGEQAYNRYSSRIAPFLISVGGYQDIFGIPWAYSLEMNAALCTMLGAILPWCTIHRGRIFFT